MKLRFIALAIAIIGLALGTAAQEWTRFRGPNGTGISEAKSIPTRISDSDINWRVELPGSGHSSPVLWGDRAFVTTTGDQAGGIYVLCLNATDGSIQWRHNFAMTPFARHKFNSFASSTPAVDSNHVYVLWNEPGHFRLAALEHDGNVAWERDFGPFVSQHGCGISPIVYNNSVIIGNEQDDPEFVKDARARGVSFIIAVNAATGKTIWQTPRRSAVVAYSTPCLYQAEGEKPALVFNSQGHGIYGVDPFNGKVLWEYNKAFDKRSVSSPIIAGDIILGSCGSGAGGNFVTAIKPGRPSKSQKPILAYQLRKSAPYVPTGIAKNNLVWLWSDGGIVSCLEASTGKLRFQERVEGDFFGSPVWVDGRLYCISTTGEIVVVEASETFKVLHRYPLGELCQSTPAVANGRMFIHTERHLISLGGPRRASARLSP